MVFPSCPPWCTNVHLSDRRAAARPPIDDAGWQWVHSHRVGTGPAAVVMAQVVEVRAGGSWTRTQPPTLSWDAGAAATVGVAEELAANLRGAADVLADGTASEMPERPASVAERS